MRPVLLAAVLVVSGGISHAGGLDINVMLSAEVAPGLYGRVNLGNAPPPPVVYAQPMLIEPQPAPLPPIYLHVPPDHARHWRLHCREYDACNRPVYFVRSREYDPEYQRYYQDHAAERDLERQRWQEHARDRDRDGDHDHGRWHDGDGHDHEHEGHDRERDHDRN